MSNLDYAASQLGAVWNMAWNRPGWRSMLDRSVDGVFKSFWAIVYTAPFPILSYVSFHRAIQQIPNIPDTPLLHAPMAVSLLVEFISYIVNWGAGLTALVMLARALGAGGRVADVIIGFNWLHVFTASIQSAPLIVAGLVGMREFAGLLAILSAILVFAFTWGIIRRSFDASGGRTFSVLALLIVIGVLTNLVVEGGASLLIQALS